MSQIGSEDKQPSTEKVPLLKSDITAKVKQAKTLFHIIAIKDVDMQVRAFCDDKNNYIITCNACSCYIKNAHVKGPSTLSTKHYEQLQM